MTAQELSKLREPLIRKTDVAVNPYDVEKQNRRDKKAGVRMTVKAIKDQNAKDLKREVAAVT